MKQNLFHNNSRVRIKNLQSCFSDFPSVFGKTLPKSFDLFSIDHQHFGFLRRNFSWMYCKVHSHVTVWKVKTESSCSCISASVFHKRLNKIIFHKTTKTLALFYFIFVKHQNVNASLPINVIRPFKIYRKLYVSVL